MEESSTYQAILEEGEVLGRLRVLIWLIVLQGERKFGPLDDSTRNAIAAQTDVDRLERTVGRMLSAVDWADLLATP